MTWPPFLEGLGHRLAERLGEAAQGGLLVPQVDDLRPRAWAGRRPAIGIASRVYRPRSAFRQVSSDGVAEPSRIGIPSICAA